MEMCLLHHHQNVSILLSYKPEYMMTGAFPSQRPVTLSFDVVLLLFYIYAWINNRDAGDLRRHCAHYDVIVMS